MVIRDIPILGNSNFNKKFLKSRLRDSPYLSFKQVSKIFEKNLSTKESIQKADKANNIVSFNRSDYITKGSKILEDTSQFKRVNIKEKKALNHLIHKEERIIHLKSLEKRAKFLKKKKMIYTHQVLNLEFYMGLLISINLLLIEIPTYNLPRNLATETPKKQ